MGKVTKWIVTLLLICFFTSNLALGNSEKEDRKSSILHVPSLQCRRILGGRNLVRVRNIVVAAIFDFMTGEDWRVAIATLTIGARAKDGQREGEGRKKYACPISLFFSETPYAGKRSL